MKPFGQTLSIDEIKPNKHFVIEFESKSSLKELLSNQIVGLKVNIFRYLEISIFNPDETKRTKKTEKA
jgi:hypothetical protein